MTRSTSPSDGCIWAIITLGTQKMTEIPSSAQIFCCDSPCAETTLLTPFLNHSHLSQRTTAPCPLPSWRALPPHLPGRLHPLPEAEVEQDDDQHQAGGELPAGRAQVIDALALVEVQHAAPTEEGNGVLGAASPPRPAQRPALPCKARQQGPGLTAWGPLSPAPERPGPQP